MFSLNNYNLKIEYNVNFIICIIFTYKYTKSVRYFASVWKKNSNLNKEIYNRKFALVRRMIECTFDIVANKWRILHRLIDVSIDFCDMIIKACCIHNFVRKRAEINFTDATHENVQLRM